MPFSNALWVAVGLQWLLDVANNTAMEPYRAFVSDKLDASQHSLGFLMQSAFTGLSQTLAYLTPSLLLWAGMSGEAMTAHHIPYLTVCAFLVGALLSVASMAWTLWTTREIALDALERARLRQLPLGLGAALREVRDAIVDMPATMKQLALVKLFQWYAMFCYWQFIVLSLAATLFGTSDADSPGFREANLVNGRIGAFYNFVAFLAAFAMMPLARRFGARRLHFACLLAAGAGMLALPLIHDRLLLFLPMLGIGVAWASMMANPYVMLAGCIPAQRNGVYMGIFNMFIVIPMLLETVTLPLYYRSLLGGHPDNVIRLAGALLLCAAVTCWFVRVREPARGAR
jgi:maltose/moltooligosaccharide transporter